MSDLSVRDYNTQLQRQLEARHRAITQHVVHNVEKNRQHVIQQVRAIQTDQQQRLKDVCVVETGCEG